MMSPGIYLSGERQRRAHSSNATSLRPNRRGTSARRLSTQVNCGARAITLCVLIGLCAAADPAAQSRPPLPPSEYAKWETLAVQPRATATGPLSPDGRWLVYGITRQNRNNELRVVEIASGKSTTLPLGEQPVFSADSQWLAYAIGVTEAEEERLQKARRPVRRKARPVEPRVG